MGLVRLLFPVDVTVEPLNAAATITDPRTREPIFGVARSAAITIPAQVQFGVRAQRNLTDAGDAPTSLGYLVILVSDAEARSWTPIAGDKITDIPSHTGIYFVTSVTPHAHKGGRARTLHLAFADRSPVKAGA